VHQAWSLWRAADEFLRVIDEFRAELLSDAACSRQTAYALNDTVDALVKARDQIRELKTQWDNVTTDWVPEWWDHEAADLNDKARQIMVEPTTPWLPFALRSPPLT
jgi:hypothetical protein